MWVIRATDRRAVERGHAAPSQVLDGQSAGQVDADEHIVVPQAAVGKANGRRRKPRADGRRERRPAAAVGLVADFVDAAHAGDRGEAVVLKLEGEIRMAGHAEGNGGGEIAPRVHVVEVHRRLGERLVCHAPPAFEIGERFRAGEHGNPMSPHAGLGEIDRVGAEPLVHFHAAADKGVIGLKLGAVLGALGDTDRYPQQHRGLLLGDVRLGVDVMGHATAQVPARITMEEQFRPSHIPRRGEDTDKQAARGLRGSWLIRKGG